MPPKVQAGTIQIQAKGAARLSPDLVVSDSFIYTTDTRKRKITLDGRKQAVTLNGNHLRAWSSNKRSKSALVALGKVLRQMGLDWKDMLGKNYEVKVKGKVLEIKF